MIFDNWLPEMQSTFRYLFIVFRVKNEITSFHLFSFVVCFVVVNNKTVFVEITIYFFEFIDRSQYLSGATLLQYSLLSLSLNKSKVIF
jgi:hypothetical protein